MKIFKIEISQAVMEEIKEHLQELNPDENIDLNQPDEDLIKELLFQSTTLYPTIIGPGEIKVTKI